MSLQDGQRVIEVDGRSWRVYAVIEGIGWDAELPIRRANWLAFESESERRYLTPLLDDWEAWDDEKLRAHIRTAPRDNRGFR